MPLVSLIIFIRNAIVYLSVSLVNTREVYLRSEGDLGRNIGVVGTAVDLDTVDAVFVDALQETSVVHLHSGGGRWPWKKAFITATYCANRGID